MATVEWSLRRTRNGVHVQKSLGDWDIEEDSVVRVRQSQAPDLLTFSIGNIEDDANDPFQYDDIVTLFRGSHIAFYGKVEDPEDDFGGDEFQHVTVSGPWKWLEETVYLQDWMVWLSNGAINTKQTTPHTHLLINRGFNTLIPVREVIISALDAAIAAGAPLQKGNILPGHVIYPPVSEVRDWLISDIVRGQLKWAPDAVVWFDYRTTPPTLHVERKKNLVAQSITLANDTVSGSIRKRRDMLRPSVTIRFENRIVQNGQEVLQMLVQRHPANASDTARKALNLSVDLMGPEINSVSQDVEVEAIEADTIAWWKRKLPALQDSRLTINSIKNARRISGTLDLPNELVGGAVASWMDKEVEDQVWEVEMDFTLTDPVTGKVIRSSPNLKLTYKMVATDSESGTFSTTSSITAGDPYPTTLAQDLYDHVSVLHHEGQVTIENDESGEGGGSFIEYLGTVINLVGPKASWSTMNALVQRETWRIGKGVTVIDFGPAGHLELQDIITLMNANRQRRRWTNPDTQDTGNVGGGGGVTLPKRNANDSGIYGEGVNTAVATVKDAKTHITSDATNGRFVYEDDKRIVKLAFTSDWDGAPSDQTKTLEVRRVKVCVTDGNGNPSLQNMLVIGGTPWPDTP
jgi:hypothetical protein